MAIVGVRLSGGDAIDTDIQSILPNADRDKVTQSAISRAGEVSSGRVAFLVEAGDSEIAQTASDDLQARLFADGLFTSDRSEAVGLGQWLFANREVLLCEHSPEEFDKAAAARTSRQALAQIYSVTGVVTGDLLRSDPFLRTLQLSECLAPRGAGTLEPKQKLITGHLNQSSYRLDTQQEIAERVDRWQAEWEEAGVSLARSGAVFFAAAGADQARNEVTRIGLFGAIGVIVLFLIVFRRIKSVVLSLLVVLVGLATGLAAALLVFPAVHVLVFVFAAMLVGITSDYAIHTLATGPAADWPSVSKRFQSVGRPITISMITTIMGFGALGIFGVSLLQQVAILSAVGLLSAWAFVLFVLLGMDTRPKNSAALINSWNRLVALRARIAIPKAVVVGFGLAGLAAIAIGATRVDFIDDVRAFQSRSPDLLEQQEKLHAAGYGMSEGTFLLTRGATPQEARKNEEDALRSAPEGLQVLALSRFDPSPSTRAASANALEAKLYDPFLADHVESVGLSVEDIDRAAKTPSITLPSMLQNLEGEIDGQTYLIAPVVFSAGWSGPENTSTSRLVDPTHGFTLAFSEYRRHAVIALVVASLCAAIVVVFVYRRMSALVIVAAPVLAVVASLMFQSALGLPLTFFSLAGGLVLLGVGLDYSAFEWEAGAASEQWTTLAVMVDAATTFLSMGLLALSATLPVQNFGLTVAIGVIVAVCLSRLSRSVGQGARG